MQPGLAFHTNIKAMEKYPQFCKIQRDMNCFHIYNMHNIHWFILKEAALLQLVA